MQSPIGRANVVLAVLTSVALLVTAGSAVAATASKIGWQFAYDTRGRTTSITGPAGKRTRIRYTDDANGRLRAVTRELPGGATVTQIFDKRGRRERMIDGAGSVRFTYDRSDRLTAVRRDGAPAISYRYDTLGRIKTMGIGPRFSVGYQYDFRGRPEKIVTPAGNVLYRYDGASGSVARKLPNGITTRWVYRPDGRLDSISHTSQDNKPLGRFQYTYRLDGLITTIRELTPAGVRQRQFGYDSTQRLVSVSGQHQPRIEYAYDKLGNRTKLRRDGGKPITSRYDWAGRLVRHSGRPCQHDPAGNLTSCNGLTATYTYNDTGLLETASLPAGTIRYRYDGDGNLVSRDSGPVRHGFIPDPLADIWRPLFVTGPGGGQTFYIWDGDSPLMAISGNEVRYYLQDHLGSVRLVSGRHGNIIERRDYTPFGEARDSSVGMDLQPGFAGLFYDNAASLYLTQARAYDPTLGRFLQPDPEHRIPLGSQKDLSTYVYCGGDPVNFVDLNGAAPEFFAQLQSSWNRFNNWRTEYIVKNVPGRGQERRHIINALNSRLVSDSGGNISLAFDKAVVLRDKMFAPYDSLVLAGHLGEFGLDKFRTNKPGPSLYEVRDVENRLHMREIVGSNAWTALPKAIVYSVAIPAYSIIRPIAGQLHVSSTGHRGQWLPHSYKSFSTIKSGYKGVWEGLVDVKNRVQNRAYQYIHKRLDKNFLSPTNQPKFISNKFASFYNRNIGVKTSYAQTIDTSIDTLRGLETTKVGGVRLAGAGGALSRLGTLEGIALDEANGRLILIGKGKRPINLPPLRLDDVVTIFRSVYQRGEAPSVSIDPISNKKTERLMAVRHGATTANTYVGWVLYEADRIMKTYQFGKDNRTRGRFHSLVPGYRNLYKRSRGSRKPVWERFWIVPARVTGMQSANAGLTTFDVLLRVNTERMEWRGGKLATARNPTPSNSAKQFQDWFTKNYDRIAKEARLQPPKECDVNSSVAVFQELRRMALITAIAETLRDQNVPFPAWMRDYPVRPCPVDETTPILRDVERGEFILTGGVQLAASDGNIHIGKGDAEHEQLTQAVKHAVAAQPLFSSVEFGGPGIAQQAVVLPGSESRQSGANILRHTDLVLPVWEDMEIPITRHFNSFHDPRGLFGRGWTLDLPRLERQPLPVSSDGKSITYAAAYELTSPLNSVAERFSETRLVPEVKGQLMVPASPGEMLGLADTNNRWVGQTTKTLIFRDGRRWHFDDQGYLVAHSDPSLVVVYRRDTLHRIHFIQAWRLQNGRRAAGGSPDAQLQLDYLGLQVKSVEASSSRLKTPLKVHYIYDEAARLIMVLGHDVKRQYSYDDGLVSGVTENDTDKLRFAYDRHGRLQSETGSDGQTVAFERIATPEGMRVVARTADTNEVLAAVTYDADYRATSQMLDDGSLVAWDNDAKEQDFVITDPGGEKYTFSPSKDGKTASVKTSGGATHALSFDDAGRIAKVDFEDGSTIEQNWLPNGQLRSAISDTEGVLQTFAKDGALSSIVVTTPEQARSRQIDRYVRLGYDAQGKVNRIEDDSGGELVVSYDASGQPSAVRSPRGTITAKYDSNGQMTSVDTTWGAGQTYNYDGESGDLSRITLQQQYGDGATEYETIDLAGGKVVRVRHLDGGETTLSYHQAGGRKGLLKEIRTANQLALAYSYDIQDRLTNVDIGGDGENSNPAYRVSYRYDPKGRLAGISYSPAAR